MTNLGIKVKKARQDYGITLKEASLITDISVAHLANIENYNKIPSVPALKRLCTAFHLSSDDLLDINSHTEELI